MTDNFKIEIISFVVNASHKFAIFNSNVEIQRVIPFVTAHIFFQSQSGIIDVLGDNAKILQIHCAYIIQISATIC